MKTSVLLDHEPVADGGYFVRALLQIEGTPPPSEGRVPLNLSLVLDRSGSMLGEPMQAAIDAATMLVRRLHPDDVVSVVAYDDRVEVVAPPSTGERHDEVIRAIGALYARGSTNLSGGWLRGRELVAENATEGGVNRVILLTDGHANEGITDPARLLGMAKAGSAAGVSTTTIGFGAGFDEDLLRGIADGGHGNSYYIEKTDQSSGVFEEELEGLCSLSAQNIRVAIEPGRHAEYANVVHDYPRDSEGNVLTIDVGDLYAREPRRLLMEFLIAPEKIGESEAHVADVTVTAHVLTEGGGVELRTIEMPITVSPEAGGRVDATVRREMLLLEAADARAKALEASSEGRYHEGSSHLRASIDRLEELDDGEDDVVREELVDLRAMESLVMAREVEERDVKYMKQRVYDSHRGRVSAKGRIRRGEG